MSILVKCKHSKRLIFVYHKNNRRYTELVEMMCNGISYYALLGYQLNDMRKYIYVATRRQATVPEFS